MNFNLHANCPTAASTTAVVGLALAAGAAQAQQLTDAQKSAMRANCRSDFMANCMSTSPGSKEALECLQNNLPKLSPGCQARTTKTGQGRRAETGQDRCTEARPCSAASRASSDPNAPATPTGLFARPGCKTVIGEADRGDARLRLRQGRGLSFGQARRLTHCRVLGLAPERAVAFLPQRAGQGAPVNVR
jgi:hypothetical protein